MCWAQWFFFSFNFFIQKKKHLSKNCWCLVKKYALLEKSEANGKIKYIFQVSQREECLEQLLSLDKWHNINVTANWSSNCWQRIKVLIFRFKPIYMKPHAVIIEPVAKRRTHIHTRPHIRKIIHPEELYQGFKAHKFFAVIHIINFNTYWLDLVSSSLFFSHPRQYSEY